VIPDHTIFVDSDHVEITNQKGRPMIVFQDQNFDENIFIREFNSPGLPLYLPVKNSQLEDDLVSHSQSDLESTVIFTNTKQNLYKYYVRENDSIILKLKLVKTRFLPQLTRGQESINKIITFDIETLLKTSKKGIAKMHPYLIVMYVGGKFKETFKFFEDNPHRYKGDRIIEAFFDKLLTPKYNGFQVYAHNLAHFDLIFIAPYLANLHFSRKYDIEILRNSNGVVLTIDIRKKNSDNKTIFHIQLKDSRHLIQG